MELAVTPALADEIPAVALHELYDLTDLHCPRVSYWPSSPEADPSPKAEARTVPTKLGRVLEACQSWGRSVRMPW